MTRVFFSLFFLYLGLLPAFAGDQSDRTGDVFSREDSLRRVIEQRTLSDSLLMDAFLELAWSLRSSNPATAVEYVSEGLSLADQLGYTRVYGRALVDIGSLYWRMGNFNQALDYYLEARQVFSQEGDTFGYARTLSSIGNVYGGQGHLDMALEYYFNALRLYEQQDSIASAASVLNNIGLVFQRQGNLDLAEEYHLRSLSIKNEYGNEQGQAFSLNNLGAVSQERGHYAKALEYFRASLEIRERYQDTREMASSTRNIGNLYLQKGEHQQAIEYLRASLDLFSKVDDQVNIARNYFLLGEVVLEMGSLRQAYHFFNRSLTLALEVGLPAMISDNYRKMSQIQAMLGNYREAYRFQEEYVALQDSIYDEEGRRRVIELQVMYDRERKEREIDLLRKSYQISTLNLEKQRLFRNFLLLFVGLVFILLVIIYNRFLVTSKTNQMLEVKKEEISHSNLMLQELNTRLMEQRDKVEDLNARLKQSERHLIESNKTKDKFFSIISHDLRNPFASIVSFSRILKRDIHQLSGEDLQELALELDKSVLKINDLLENLLYWSRSQTGKISYQPEYFEIKDIVRDNVHLFDSTAREKNIEVLDHVQAGLKVWGDVNMTNTVMRNIFSNALKYTSPGGKVEMKSFVRNGMVEISVIDDGMGISAEDQRKLFRVDSLHTTYGTLEEKGSGLGLLICKEFVEKQGGRIFFSSQPGEGAEFTFTLPARDTVT